MNWIFLLIGIVIGLFVGTNLAILVVGLCQAASNTDLEMSEHNNGIAR